MNKIKELIDSIEAGNSEATHQIFDDVMAEKVTTQIQARREELGSNIFAEAKTE